MESGQKENFSLCCVGNFLSAALVLVCPCKVVRMQLSQFDSSRDLFDSWAERTRASCLTTLTSRSTSRPSSGENHSFSSS